ncbi:MAG: DNA polymerase III subunit beta [Pirellulales bacterium]|nr:DNA polymerase III subunit beta [Pirellulales bacterium]
MKITCNREKLLRAFGTVASVVPQRSPKPILSNVKVMAEEELVVLMGTDMENSIRSVASGVEVTEPGEALLPIDRFGSILRESSDEKLSIEDDGKRILVQGDRSKFQLPSEDPAKFPAIGSFEEETYRELPAPLFRELIRRTIFATDNENSRYALGGVLIEFENDNIFGIATDGRRLAKQVGTVKAIGEQEASDQMTIVPTRGMQLIDRAIAENDDEIRILAKDNEFLVRSSRSTIHVRLAEGRFPNWRGVFPSKENLVKIDIAVGPFHAAVRQAAIVTSKDRRGVDFTFGDGKVMLSGHGAELGESHIELPIPYDGGEITVKLDPRFVSDFLKVLQPEQTFGIEIRDSKTAAVCTTDDGYSYVIMPLERKEPERKAK